jgi:hypothetical protein
MMDMSKSGVAGGASCGGALSGGAISGGKSKSKLAKHFA